MEFKVVVSDDVIQNMVKEHVVNRLNSHINSVAGAAVHEALKEHRTHLETAVEKFLEQKFKEEDIKTWIDEAIERIIQEKID